MIREKQFRIGATFESYHWRIEQRGQGSPHLQTQLKTVPALTSLDASLTFPFHLLRTPVHPTGLFFYIFPGFLAICISSSNDNSIMTTCRPHHSSDSYNCVPAIPIDTLLSIGMPMTILT